MPLKLGTAGLSQRYLEMMGASFCKDVVEGALRCSVRICRMCRPIESHVHGERVRVWRRKASRDIFHPKRGTVGVGLLPKLIKVVICAEVG